MLTKPRNNNITISSIIYKCLLYYIFPQILFFSFVLFFLLCSDHLLISLTAITMISVWTIPTSISIPIYPIRNRRARFSICFSHIIASNAGRRIRTSVIRAPNAKEKIAVAVFFKTMSITRLFHWAIPAILVKGFEPLKP